MAVEAEIYHIWIGLSDVTFLRNLPLANDTYLPLH